MLAEVLPAAGSTDGWERECRAYGNEAERNERDNVGTSHQSVFPLGEVMAHTGLLV